MAGKPINQAVGKKALDVSVDSRLLVQERNLKGAVSGKGKKCGAGGGRKPLGDLYNAGKPINQAGGKKALHVSVDSRTEPEGYCYCSTGFQNVVSQSLLSESPHIELEEEEYYGLQEVTEPEIYIRRYRPLTPMSSPECRKLLDELEALYSERPDARK